MWLMKERARGCGCQPLHFPQPCSSQTWCTVVSADEAARRIMERNGFSGAADAVRVCWHNRYMEAAPFTASLVVITGSVSVSTTEEEARKRVAAQMPIADRAR